MEEEELQNSSVINELNQMREAMEEQTKVFPALINSIKVVSKQLPNERSFFSDDNGEVSQTASSPSTETVSGLL